MAMETRTVERLASRADVLTVVPPALPKLLSALSEPDLDIRKLAQLLGQYPSIAAKIIGAANSAWASPVKPITDLLRACTALGLNFVLALAIGLSIGSRRLPPRTNFDARNHWFVAFAASRVVEAASRLGIAKNLADPSATATSGLLHNLGVLLLLHALPQETERALVECRSEGTPLGPALRTHTGVGLGEAGAFLAGRWSLPSELLVPIEHHENHEYAGTDETGVLLVGFSSNLAETLAQGSLFVPTNPWAVRLGLPEADALALWDTAVREQQKLMDTAKTLFGSR
jgi:HD-like signal output (HDOD) protein